MAQTQEAPSAEAPLEAPPEGEVPAGEAVETEAEETPTVIRVAAPSRPRPILLAAVGVPALALSFLGGCFVSRAAAPPPVVKHADWSYSSPTGPAAWGELDPTFKTCAVGAQQSPIDLHPSRLAQYEWLSPVQFKYKASKIKLLNSGHGGQANFEPGSKMTFLGQDFELKQVHAHAPSEHTVSGRQLDMELHMVHAAPDGRLVMVGIFAVEGPEHPALAKFWNQLPAQPGPEMKTDVTLSAEELLPRDRRYYFYDGSLTTPPCTEGVRWIVLKEPIFVSKAQIQKIKDMFHGNARPVQPVRDRFIREELPPLPAAR